MTFGVTESVRKVIEKEIIEKGQESVTSDGFTFSTERNTMAIPTGMRTMDGKMIYIQP